MGPAPVLTCPKCRAAVRPVPLGIALAGDLPGAQGNILTRCPRCQGWSWMTLQQQEA